MSFRAPIVLFGEGGARRSLEDADLKDAKKALIVTERSAPVEDVINALNNLEVSYDTFRDAMIPSLDVVATVVERALVIVADVIIGVGRFGPINVAKIARLVVEKSEKGFGGKQSPPTLQDVKDIATRTGKHRSVKLVSIPTGGCGADASAYVFISQTSDTSQPSIWRHRLFIPDFLIADTYLTTTRTNQEDKAAVMESFAVALEVVMSPEAPPPAKALASKALNGLLSHGSQAVNKATKSDRLHASQAVVSANLCLAGGRLGLTHALARRLRPLVKRKDPTILGGADLFGVLLPRVIAFYQAKGVASELDEIVTAKLPGMIAALGVSSNFDESSFDVERLRKTREQICEDVIEDLYEGSNFHCAGITRGALDVRAIGEILA